MRKTYVEKCIMQSGIKQSKSKPNLIRVGRDEKLNDEIVDLKRQLFEKDNANAIDEIFSGTFEGLLTFVQGVANLGYSPVQGVNVTVGGLLTVAILGALIVFILRLFFGGAKS